jgi:hypothetical protein
MKTMLSLFAALLLTFSPAGSIAQSAPGQNAGMGTVYVFRPADDAGGAYALTYQNQTIARVKAGTYVSFKLPEGRQFLLADPKADQLYGLDVTTGASYYIRVASTGNLLRRHPGLVNSSAREFESIRPSLDEIQANKAFR